MTWQKENEDQDKLITLTAAVIAKQDGLHLKHGITPEACGEIYLKIFSEIMALFAGNRDLYTFPKA